MESIAWMAWTLADRDLLRAAGVYACGHDLARRRLSRSRARRRPAHSDHARRPAVRVADPRRRHSSAVDRLSSAPTRITTLPIGEEGFEISSLWLATLVSLGVGRAGVSHGLGRRRRQIREINPGLRVRQSLQRRNNMRRLERRTGPNTSKIWASKVWASRVLMMTSAVALMAASAAVSCARLCGRSGRQEVDR